MPWPVGSSACPVLLGDPTGRPAAARANGGGRRPALRLPPGVKALDGGCLLPSRGCWAAVVRSGGTEGSERARGCHEWDLCYCRGAGRRQQLARYVRALVARAWAAVTVPSLCSKELRQLLPIVGPAVSLRGVSAG